MITRITLMIVGILLSCSHLQAESSTTDNIDNVINNEITTVTDTAEEIISTSTCAVTGENCNSETEKTDPSTSMAEPEKSQLEQLSQYMNCENNGGISFDNGTCKPGLVFCEIDPAYYKKYYSWLFAIRGISIKLENEGCEDSYQKIGKNIAQAVDADWKRKVNNNIVPNIERLKEICDADKDFVSSILSSKRNSGVIDSCPDVNTLSSFMEQCKKEPKKTLRKFAMMGDYTYIFSQHDDAKRGLSGLAAFKDGKHKKDSFPIKKLAELYSKHNPEANDCFEATYLIWSYIDKHKGRL